MSVVLIPGDITEVVQEDVAAVDIYVAAVTTIITEEDINTDVRTIIMLLTIVRKM